MRKIIILAGGKQERYPGETPKALLPIGSYPLLLVTWYRLSREQRQDTIVIARSPVLVNFCQTNNIPVTQEGLTDTVCGTLLSQPFGSEHTTVLHGDVLWGDDGLLRVLEITPPPGVVFWGDTVDWYAISWPSKHNQILRDALPRCQDRDGKLWSLLAHLPRNVINLQFIDDRTQDFDTPEQFEEWQQGKVKNPLFRRKLRGAWML